MIQNALLVLADGTSFSGLGMGLGPSPDAERRGEVVFNTSMAGYQEILTDPSYAGQILVMTCPELGNVGVNAADAESSAVQVAALVAHRLNDAPSNWRANGTLRNYLQEHSVPALTAVDTRAVTAHLRQHGTQRGIVGLASTGVDTLLARLLQDSDAAPCDWVGRASTPAPYAWTEPTLDLAKTLSWQNFDSPKRASQPFKVAALDLGIKRTMLRLLVDAGCEVTVWPARTSAATLLASAPDGIFVGNGPGDPAHLPEIVATIKALLGRVPLFGVCLGHQLLALALGGSTFKMKFGHRGGNHPVHRLHDGRVLMTAQNHGYAVDGASLKDAAQITHIALNDGSVAGIEARAIAAFSVQFHPEASPGPHDARALFGQFVAWMQAPP